jgi:hypothetical protein
MVAHCAPLPIRETRVEEIIRLAAWRPKQH